ncbi:MAG: TadE family protein [Dehalococcoidia bacterium]
MLRTIKGRWQGARNWRNGQSGQALVEFSLILPVFLMLLFGLVDFGRGFYTWQLVTNAAREGARAAAVQSDSAGVDAKLYGSFCSAWPTPSSCALDTTKMTVTKTNIQGARGQQTTVVVAYTFNFVTPIGPLLALFGGSNISAPTISATTSMRLE